MQETVAQNPTLSLFSPYVGTTFQLLLNGQPALDLTLVEAVSLDNPLIERDSSLRSDPFSLTFHGPLNPYARQETYQLSHPGLGTVEMFLVPNGPDKQTKSKMQYQAIFN